MPELPEVEVIRRGVAHFAVGRTIAEVAVEHPRAVRRHLAGVVDLRARLRAARIAAARRRGKFLWLPLDTGEAVLVHLGMSGQLRVVAPRTPAEPHLRVRFGFADDGPELRFVDQRTFGGIAVDPLVLDPDGEEVPASVRHIARDPLDPRFDADAFARRVRRRRSGLKRALLDQTLISGIGNIYADEALWQARLHYARPTETLRRSEIDRVLTAAIAVMQAALAAGGTSFDSLYVNVNGQSGYFERSLAVYGRAERDCPRCGVQIRREAFMNRSSFRCPRCQPRPRRARW